MKIKVDDERVFPTLGITAQAGDEVDVPSDSDTVAVKSGKAGKAADTKEGDE